MEVERHPTAHYAWRKRSLAVTGSETLASIERDIATDVALPERLLLKLTLKGAVSLSTWSDVTAWLKTLEQRLFHLSVDNQALQVVPEAVELDEFGTGDLRRVADLLSAAARDEASGKAEVASACPPKLYGLWQEARGGEIMRIRAVRVRELGCFAEPVAWKAGCRAASTCWLDRTSSGKSTLLRALQVVHAATRRSRGRSSG